MRAHGSGRGLHNIPADLTSFVGRRRELAEIKKLLGSSRLVTVTGPGGVGKTRLAIRAATEMARAFPEGVWLVELARIRDPMLVAQAVFDALGVHDLSAGWSLTTLADYLLERHLLLILDNCEHLLDSCAVLASTLLESCPKLRMLATSREPLGTAGEARMLLPPLSLPLQADGATVEDLVDFDAIRLLSERAAAVLPGFTVDVDNAAAVVLLCRRLDGIPLALELAAVRLASLSPDQLNRALAKEPSILGRGNRGAQDRQQTLEATISWSYGLLEHVERLLWARLSVFAGGFDEESAVTVCSDERVPADEMSTLLGSLVEKSMLKWESNDGGKPRYSLLETLRAYGRQRLLEQGEEAAIQKRHFDWICALARAAGVWDSKQPEMFDRMYVERDNLWAALEYCLREQTEAAAAAELAQHLMPYWVCRGPYRDVRRILAALANMAEKDSLARARFLWVEAVLATTQNDFEAAAALSDEARRIGTELNNAEVVGWCLIHGAMPRWIQGELTEALNMFEAAISLARLMDLPAIELVALITLSGISAARGELEHAIEVGDQALTLSRECGELWQRGYLLNFLSQANWSLGHPKRAEAQAREGVICKGALDDRTGLSILLETLAWMAAERSRHQRAAELLGSADRVRESSTLPVTGLFREQHEYSVTVVVQALGKAAFQAAFDRGRAMTIDEAVAFAVDETEPPKPKPQPAVFVDSMAVLTRREREIAALVAQGLTNRQIAARLVVSERTAESHIFNILNKLGFNSRSQIASWAVTHQPRGPAELRRCRVIRHSKSYQQGLPGRGNGSMIDFSRNQVQYRSK